MEKAQYIVELGTDGLHASSAGENIEQRFIVQTDNFISAAKFANEHLARIKERHGEPAKGLNITCVALRGSVQLIDR